MEIFIYMYIGMYIHKYKCLYLKENSENIEIIFVDIQSLT